MREWKEEYDMDTHITMKEMPQSEQPVEKCVRGGAHMLSDAELLAVILKTGTKSLSALQLAQLLLSQGDGNLLNLVYMDLEDMQKIPGIGQVKAVQLKCVAELSKRITRTRRAERVRLDNPGSIAAYYMESLRHEPKEKLVLAMFDSKSRLLADEIVSIGTVNASLVSPREIFLKALAYGSVQIVLLHNHPSGDPKPSGEDIRVTKSVAMGGDLIGIALVDHIIIGNNRYKSFREEGLLG